MLFIIALSFGCDENSTQATKTNNDQLIPLKVGNCWVYKVEFIDTTSKQIDLTLFDTLQIQSTEIINGETWYFSPNGIKLRNSSWGLEEYITTESSEIDPPYHKYKYPCSVNDSWKIGNAFYDYYPNNDLKDTIEFGNKVTSMETNVNLALGNFNCIVYQQYIKKPDGSILDGFVLHQSNKTYFCKNIGIIQREMLILMNNKIHVIKSQLVNYHLN